MDARPIGVFDSGFGGITVLAEVAKLLPGEDLIFLGDNLHAPYGDRSPAEVLAYTRAAVDLLLAQDCKAIVIACNTATSAAGAAVRQAYNLPIIGMEPALKPAELLPGEGNVLVMATAMTLRLEKFHLLMQRYGQHAIPVPCPGLVELIEAGEVAGERMQAMLHALLSPHLKDPVKAVVLGCTHYVFLRPTLAAFLPGSVQLVDGNLGTARQLHAQLMQHDLLRDSEPAAPGGRTIRFASTAPGDAIPRRMEAWFARALALAGAACISQTGTVQ